jgi:hypothetical protein
MGKNSTKLVTLLLARTTPFRRPQGDQNGPIFTQRVIVFFGQLLENYRSIQGIWAILFHG